MHQTFDELQLTRKTFYVIRSMALDTIYVDRYQNGHLYESEQEANHYIHELQRETQKMLQLQVQQMDGCNEKDFLSECYRYGCLCLVWHKKNSNATENIHIQDMYCHPDYYNTELSARIAALRGPNSREDLIKLRTCHLLMPVHIDNQADTPRFIYPVVTAPNDPEVKFYIGFTDLRLYKTWQLKTKNSGKYEALEVQFRDVARICKAHGLVINPFNSNVLLLSPLAIEQSQT